MSMRQQTGISAGAETTQADNLLRGVDPTDAPSYAGGHVITEPKPGGIIDRMDLTALDRERLGIGPEEVHSYIRNPDVWAQNELGDRFIEFEQTYPGARIPKDAQGRPRRFGQDLVLVCYPREHKEAAHRQAAQDFKDYMGSTEEGGGHHEGHFDVTDQDAVSQAAADNHERLHAERMIGENSPTHGQNLMEAEARYSEEQIEAEEAKFRIGRRHQALTQEQFHDLMTTKRSGSSTISIPNNVRPKNFMRRPAAEAGK